MGKLISPPELSLDFKPTFIPYKLTQFLGEMARVGSDSEKILKLENLISRLEAEVIKIDMFKRELPLCMLLMSDAIATLKKELKVFKKSTNQPVLEEFIPLKKPCDEDSKVETDSGDKRNWLSSTQLWNTDQTRISKHDSLEPAIQKIGKKQQNGMIDDSYHNDSGKEFMLFKGYSAFPVEDKDETPVSGLSLNTPGYMSPFRGNNVFRNIGADINLQISRKQRRCWSTDLHKRFVNALQELGGSKAATPKQIRELMGIDGLTSDEVKSHLQKYRLHTKRLSSNPSNVVSSGLWVQPDDRYVEKHTNSQSGSPDGPLLNSATGGTSTTGGDSMDDGEDEKSENNCWKSHVYTSVNGNV